MNAGTLTVALPEIKRARLHLRIVHIAVLFVGLLLLVSIVGELLLHGAPGSSWVVMCAVMTVWLGTYVATAVWIDKAAVAARCRALTKRVELSDSETLREMDPESLFPADSIMSITEDIASIFKVPAGNLRAEDRFADLWVNADFLDEDGAEELTCWVEGHIEVCNFDEVRDASLIDPLYKAETIGGLVRAVACVSAGACPTHE